MKALKAFFCFQASLLVLVAWIVAVGRINTAMAASPAATSPDKVVVLADRIRLNKKTNLLHANGHAFISKASWTLRADSLILNKRTSVVWGAGHVIFKGPRTTMKGDRIRANLLTGEAVLYHGKVNT